MSVKRSPPNKLTEVLYDSEPDVPKPTSPQQLASNITQRFKRKFQHGEDITQFTAEVKSILKEFTEGQDKKYAALLSTVNAIKDECSELRKSVDFVSTSYDEIMGKLKNLDSANREKMAYIQVLEEKIEVLEGSIKSSCLEFRNIPIKLNESKNSLCDTVIQASSLLQNELKVTEIRDIFRAKSKKSPESGTIVVELTTVIAKETLLHAYKNYNKGGNKLSTSDIQLPGPCKQIYISEALTAKKRQLFYQARMHAKSHGYAFCWIANGRILLRKKEGDPAILIKSDSDLNKLKQSMD